MARELQGYKKHAKSKSKKTLARSMPVRSRRGTVHTVWGVPDAGSRYRGICFAGARIMPTKNRNGRSRTLARDVPCHTVTCVLGALCCDHVTVAPMHQGDRRRTRVPAVDAPDE